MRKMRKLLALLLAVLTVLTTVNLPTRAAEEVTLVLGQDTKPSDYVYWIEFTGFTENQLTSIPDDTRAAAELIVNGQTKPLDSAKAAWRQWSGMNNVRLILDASYFGETGTKATWKDYVVTIPKGSDIHGIKVKEDLTFSLTQGELVAGNINGIDLKLGADTKISEWAYWIEFSGFTESQLTAIPDNTRGAVDLLVNGQPKTADAGIAAWRQAAGSDKVTLILDAQFFGETGKKTAWKDYVITIPAGSTIHGLPVKTELTFSLLQGEVIGGNENNVALELGADQKISEWAYWIDFAGFSQEQLTEIPDNTRGVVDLLVNGQPKTADAGIAAWRQAAGSDKVTLILDAQFFGETGKKTAWKDYTITIPKDSTIHGIPVKEDFTFSLVAGEVVEGELSKVTVTLQDNPANADSTPTTGGFYFNVDPKDELAYNGNWTVRYTATEGGVSIDDGEPRADVPMIKLGETLYYVALSDKGITPVKGMKVTVDGTYGSGTATVKMMAATFVYHGDNKWTLGGSVEEDPYSEATYEVLDIYQLLSVPSVTITNDANYSLVDLGKKTNVALQASVKVDSTNSSQDYTLALSKTVANNVWHDSGYQIKFYPQSGRIRILVGADGNPVAEVINADVLSGEFNVEYGIVDLLNKSSEVAARKIFVKINGVEVLQYQDDDLSRTLGTYVPAYAYSHETAGMKVIIGSITHKDYQLVPHTPKVQDVSELIAGLSSIELNTQAETHVGTLAQSTDIALKTKVVFNTDFGVYEDPRYDELKIAIGKTNAAAYWDLEKSGYELWIRPDRLYIGYNNVEPAATVEFDVPNEFTLEFGTYDIEIQKNGVKTGDYGKQVYVKIDGNEVLTWLDMSGERVLGKEVITYASEYVDADLKSLTSTRYLIRKSNTVADIFDATGLSETKLNKNGLTRLGELSKESQIALRTKVKMNTDATELKLAMSKQSDQGFWDAVKSGWQFWLRPEMGRIYIGYGTDEIGAVADYDFKEEFTLEVGQRDVVYNDGTPYGREVYIKIDGQDVVSWIDTDNSRPLGKYLLAYTSDNADVTLTSLTTEGYIPVDKVAVPVDIFDVSQYATMELKPSTTMHLGDLEQFVGKSLKMKVNGNTDATEFKIGVAKTSTNNFWEPAGAGWQFWIRPESGKVYIGYGITEFAEFADYEFPEQYELEVGARKVYYKNGKYMGVRLFVNIDGQEIVSWIDKDANRLVGDHVLFYASQDCNATISTLYATKELPVSYLVNGEEQAECDLVTVNSTIVVGKDSRVNVDIAKDKDRYVDYKSFRMTGIEQLPDAERTDAFEGKYTYLLKEPKDTEQLVIELNTYVLTTDEAQILDFYDVAGVDSISVKSGEDMGVGNMMMNGNPCGVNTAMQFVVDIPHKFNSIRVTILGDNPNVWSVNGALLNIQKERVFLQNPANQATFAQASDKMFSEGNSIYVEFGIVKCYADGIYRYDRAYVKAGMGADDMKLLAWYDNTERGGYGSGVVCRGLDTEGVSYTLRSMKNLHKLTDVSEQKMPEVYYPKYVAHGSDASITLYTAEGEKLQSLSVAGKTVETVLTDDGAYVYQIADVSKDINFAYKFTADNTTYKVTAEAAEQLEIEIDNTEVAAAGRTDVTIKAKKGYVLDTVTINGSDYTEYFVYDNNVKGWKATITGIREDKVITATATEKQYKISVTGAKNTKVTFGGDVDGGMIPAGGLLKMTIEPDSGYYIRESFVNGTPIATSNNVLQVDSVYSDTDEIVIDIQVQDGEAKEASGQTKTVILVTVGGVVLLGLAVVAVLLIKGKKKGAKANE